MKEKNRSSREGASIEGHTEKQDKELRREDKLENERDEEIEGREGRADREKYIEQVEKFRISEQRNARKEGLAQIGECRKTRENKKDEHRNSEEEVK